MAKDPAFLFYPGDWLGGTMTFSRHQKGAYMDLLMCQFNQGSLTLTDIKIILGTDFYVWEKLKLKFTVDSFGRYYNPRLEEEKLKRELYTKSRKHSTDEGNVKIYLIKDNISGSTKIGSSVNPLRRFAEMCNQENPAITLGDKRDYSLIFTSKIVPRSEEKVLHAYFKDKRREGEWFILDNVDTEYVRSSYGESYDNRTNIRTEDENKDLFKQTKTKAVLNEQFESLWFKYPRKIGKVDAECSFKSQVKTKEDFVDIVKALENFLNSNQVKKGETQFIPHGSTWFNNRWKDYIDWEEEKGGKNGTKRMLA